MTKMSAVVLQAMFAMPPFMLAQTPQPALQQTIPLPSNYHTIFDNRDLLVMRVHYGAHEFVPVHDHSDYPTVYVYLNDSGPVDIVHAPPNVFTLTRPPTHTGAFRISPGASERHSIQSRSDAPSDFLRIELKQIPIGGLHHMFRGDPAPPDAEPGTTVPYKDEILSVSRTICPANATCKLPSGAERSLLVPISIMHIRGGGVDKQLQPGEVLWLSADAPPMEISPGAQCLRVSLFYR